MKLLISNGNSKLGSIPNVSSLPIKDCPNCTTCKHKCYALKALRLYPNARRAWTNNSKILHSSLHLWSESIIDYCQKHEPKLFRFQQAGDIISKKHFEACETVAKWCPSTRLFLFTKSFQYIPSVVRQSNLSVVLSLFPTMKLPAKLSGLPRAYAGCKKDYPRDARAKNAIECAGNCEACGICWDLKNVGKDVIFAFH